MIKDGHTFSIHLVDPKSDEELARTQAQDSNTNQTQLSSNQANDSSKGLGSNERSNSRQNLSSTNMNNANLNSEMKIRLNDNSVVLPKDKSVAKYTCFTGVLNDGLSISYSTQSPLPKSNYFN